MLFQKSIDGYNSSLVQLGSAAALVHELDLDWMESISESLLGVAIHGAIGADEEQRETIKNTAAALRQLICAGNAFKKALPELLFQEGDVDGFAAVLGNDEPAGCDCDCAAPCVDHLRSDLSNNG
jgi:hypothetical protein